MKARIWLNENEIEIMEWQYMYFSYLLAKLQIQSVQSTAKQLSEKDHKRHIILQDRLQGRLH